MVDYRSFAYDYSTICPLLPLGHVKTRVVYLPIRNKVIYRELDCMGLARTMNQLLTADL
jgi:hypothetical protein